MAFTKYDYDSLPYVLFGSNHSYKTYGLILESYEIGVPELKTIKYSTLFSDGDIDETDSVRSTNKFKNRTIILNFKVIDDVATWNNVHNAVKGMNGSFIDDIYISPEMCHYSGRISLNPFKTNCFYQTLSIKIDAKPYCYATAYHREVNYNFNGAYTYEIDITSLGVSTGDMIYAYHKDDRYITIGNESEKFLKGSNYIKYVLTCTEDATKITLRTNATSASYRNKDHKIVFDVVRKKNGW